MPRGWERKGRSTVADTEQPQEDITTQIETAVVEDTTATTGGENTVSVDTVETPQDIAGTILDEQPELQSQDTTEAPTETAEQTAERKRAPRPAINVGNVVVRPSTRTDFTTRATPTESNPVFLAVKAAPLDTPTDILVENDKRKIDGAISIMRRAGAKLGVGMHIAPKGAEGYPTEDVESLDADDNTVTTTYAVLTFKTSAERQVRGKKDADTPDVAAAE
jgi:hypothetical protein